MTILKLGGSILTDKKVPFSIKWDNLERIGLEIKESLNNLDNLIIIHGGGSFGHPVAKKYLKDNKFINMNEGFWEIQRAMRRFNNIIIDILQSYDIPAVSIQPSSFAYYKENKIFFDTYTIRLMLKKGLIPVVHGDIIVSEDNYKIISGDDIAPILAKDFKFKILYATDVDGIYVNGEVIDEINSSNYNEILNHLKGSEGIDITGGMAYKIKTLYNYKVDAQVFNGNKKRYIYKALSGKNVGTRILFGDIA
ncbi:isopentenyl phosphate kinase [Methanocaldococcus indicus]|uniref:isopentenyl phosphate kinase n=1 Tax=Methanocaldococcus indicus TaxID=213231 RepID=UPI003C6D2E53